jgi:hypothetical protein
VPLKLEPFPNHKNPDIAFPKKIDAICTTIIDLMVRTENGKQLWTINNGHYVNEYGIIKDLGNSSPFGMYEKLWANVSYRSRGPTRMHQLGSPQTGTNYHVPIHFRC